MDLEPCPLYLEGLQQVCTFRWLPILQLGRGIQTETLPQHEL